MAFCTLRVEKTRWIIYWKVLRRVVLMVSPWMVLTHEVQDSVEICSKRSLWPSNAQFSRDCAEHPVVVSSLLSWKVQAVSHGNYAEQSETATGKGLSTRPHGSIDRHGSDSRSTWMERQCIAHRCLWVSGVYTEEWWSRAGSCLFSFSGADCLLLKRKSWERI